MRAVKDFSSDEPSILDFKKGDVIRILKNKNLQLSKGKHVLSVSIIKPLGAQVGDHSTNWYFSNLNVFCEQFVDN